MLLPSAVRYTLLITFIARFQRWQRTTSRNRQKLTRLAPSSNYVYTNRESSWAIESFFERKWDVLTFRMPLSQLINEKCQILYILRKNATFELPSHGKKGSRLGSKIAAIFREFSHPSRNRGSLKSRGGRYFCRQVAPLCRARERRIFRDPGKPSSRNARYKRSLWDLTVIEQYDDVRECRSHISSSVSISEVL